MKIASLVVALLVAGGPAFGADDPGIEGLATCKESWLDWKKDDPARLEDFGDHFRSAFSHSDNGPGFVPRASLSIAGMRVTQVFPESVGMGVGFSVTVDATFDKVRRSVERKFGKSLQKCDDSEGMRNCELEIADQRTFMLMAGDGPKDVTTLLGCYYYYEK